MDCSAEKIEITREFLMNLPSNPNQFEDMLIHWRHILHSHPETSMEEIWTSEFVAKILKALNLDVVQGVGGTGVVATLQCGKGTKKIGLRAELDALNIQEETGKEYCSKIPGKSHACGHDAHIVMLLGAAIKLVKDLEFDGTVRFIFQPGEEDGKGAKAMISDGFFKKFPLDEIYTIHCAPTKPLGVLSACPGAFQASEDNFEILIKGKGGHSARPNLTVDPLVIAAELVIALQTIVSRKIVPHDPIVISCTEIHMDGSHNAIGSYAVIRGDVRSYSPEIQDQVEEYMRKLSLGICHMNGADCVFRYNRVYAPTINHIKCLDSIMNAARKLWGMDCVRTDAIPSMASEDFGAFTQIVPGCTVDFGIGEVNKSSLHTATFDFNDRAIMRGVNLWCQLVHDVLH